MGGYFMKARMSFVTLFVSAVFFGGCSSVTPPEGAVFVYPGLTKTFAVDSVPAANEISWLLDDVEVQTGGTSLAIPSP
jgi:hypothetical protein